MSNNIIGLIVIFCRAYELKIMLVLAVILSSLISFQWGRNYEKEQKSTEIKINLVENKAAVSPSPAEGNKPAIRDQSTKTNTLINNCTVVASKSSNKYHLPSCRNTVRISDGNRVCFSSKQEAEAKGLEPAKCCHK